MEETGHKLLVGNPEKIRKRAISRHKNDRLDAELILTLLMRGEFPAIWRRSSETNQISASGAGGRDAKRRNTRTSKSRVY
jgi:transposase